MKKILMLIGLTLVLSSCVVSHEEKEQRRTNAFDVSGTYKVTTSSYTVMTLDLYNETDYSNIYGVVNRGDFTSAEMAAFNRLNISLNDVEKFRTRFHLGLGKHNTWFVGGENISDDLGESSKVYINTSQDEALLIGNYNIEYSVSGTMHKVDRVLRGTITMTITLQEMNNDQKKYVVKEKVEMAF